MKAAVAVVKDVILAQSAPVYEVDRVMTISEWIIENEVFIPPGTMLARNDDYVLRRDWEVELINDNDVLVFMPLPLQGGGGQGGNSALQIVLLVVIMVAAYLTGGAAVSLLSLTGPAASLTFAVVSAVVMIAGTYALNAIFAPDAAKQSKESNTYNLGNQQNLARPGDVIPVLIGRFRFYPNLIAQPYVETFNDESWLYLFMCLTQGHCEVHQINIEDTPIERFYRKSYDYEIYPPNYAGPYLFPVAVINSEAVANVELKGNGISNNAANDARNQDISVPTVERYEPWSGPYVISNRGIGFSEMAMDFSFSRGLYYTDQEDTYRNSVGICVQVREIGYNDDAYKDWGVFIDPAFYANGTAFTNGPVVTTGPSSPNAGDGISRSFFYLYFDHHPGFLTKRVEEEDTIGDTDQTKYARGISHPSWMDESVPDTQGIPSEYAQTINITGWVADGNGLVNGVPLEQLDGTDLQVVDMQEVINTTSPAIPGVADKSKIYYRATILVPMYSTSVSLWQEGIDYVEGEVAGPNKDGDDSIKIQIARVRRSHTSTLSNQPPPFGMVLNTSGTGAPPAWGTGIVYALGAYVVYGGVIYQCIVAHTAGATFAGDVSKWTSQLMWERGPGQGEIGEYCYTSFEFKGCGYEGCGGTNLRYSKWYNFGAALQTDWILKYDSEGVLDLGVHRGPTYSILFQTIETGNYSSYYATVEGNINPTGTEPRATFGASGPANIHPYTIPPSTVVIERLRQTPFVQTVKSKVSQITDEMTTLDIFGNKTNVLARVNRQYGRFEARFRTTSRERFESSDSFNNVVLSALKLYLPERRTYGDITTMVMKIKGNYVFNQSTKYKVNVEATRKLPIYRATNVQAIKDNGVATLSKYGAGAIEIELEQEASYTRGDLIDITGVDEGDGAVSAIEIGGIPAAMLDGKKLLLAKTGPKKYIIMLDKVVSIRSANGPLAGGIASILGKAWSGATTYVVGDVVSLNNGNFRCILGHAPSHTPPNATYWEPWTTVSAPLWVSGTGYIVGDMVSWGDKNYRSKLGGTNHVPPNGTYWDVLTGKSVLTLNGISMAVGNDGPDNLTGLGLRLKKSGKVAYQFVSSGFSLTVEDGSPDVRFSWVGHGFSVGDDITFANVPDSVPDISGVSAAIWEKMRHEEGMRLGDVKYPNLMRVAHVVTRVIDADTFYVTLRQLNRFMNDGEVIEQPVKLVNAPKEAVVRVEYETSGGFHYAKIQTIPAWAPSTVYALSYFVRYGGVVYRCTNAHTSSTTFDAGKFTTTDASAWDTSAHTVAQQYVGGRIYLDPPSFIGTVEHTFAPGEWCHHAYQGGAIDRVYQKKPASGNITVSKTGGFTANQEPGYPASAHWDERNRTLTGPPSYFFDIIGVDVINARYKIAPSSVTFTELYKSTTTQKLGVLARVVPNFSVELGNSSIEKITVGRPIEYIITGNTAHVVAVSGVASAEPGSLAEIVLTGSGVADRAVPTQQDALSIDIGGAAGWSDANGEYYPTRAISWAFMEILRSRTYGAGMSDENIGISDLIALEDLWSGRGAWSGTDRDASYPEEWVASHAYVEYDRVRRTVNGNISLYFCYQGHTSSSADAPGNDDGFAYWRRTSAGVPDTVNGIFDKQTTIWSALGAVAGVGRAAPTVIHGSVVSAVRDDYKTTPRQMFSDRNIKAGSLKVNYQSFTEDENDSLAIKFINERTWTEDQVMAFAADPENPFYYCHGYVQGNTLISLPLTWASTTTYRKNEYVMHSAVQYISLQAGNTNHTPVSSPTWWTATTVVFVPDSVMDGILWDDGEEMTIISWIDDNEVIVSVFDEKGTPTDPQPFTMLKGTHLNPASIDGWGFTVHKQAWREAKFRVDSTRNRRATITFTVEKEGIIARYGDRVIVAGLWGQAGDIAYSESATDGFTYLTLDRELRFKDDASPAYSLTNNPVTIKQGSREVTLSSETPHRLTPGTVITIVGLSGTIGGVSAASINNLTSVHSVIDDYTFVLLSDTVGTDDASGGGAIGAYTVSYDGNVLNTVLRKKDGSVVGPMAITFYENPSSPDYFKNFKIDTDDLAGFVPVFDTDMEKTHYLIGMSNSFRRDAKVTSVLPRENEVDITVWDDGDNSHYESDLTYKYFSDIDTDKIPVDHLAPRFEYGFDEDGFPIPIVSVSVTGTAGNPYVIVSWTPAKGAVSYIVAESDIRIMQWQDVERTQMTSVTLRASLGHVLTYRVTPLGYGEGSPAYFSGIARFDGSTRASISFPGKVIKTGKNIDLEPLDDTDATTVAASEIRRNRNILGVKNGYNRHFLLPTLPIDYDQVAIEFGTPQQLLSYVPTRYFPLGSAISTGGSNGRKDIYIDRASLAGWAGVFVGNRVRIVGASGLFVRTSVIIDMGYSGGGWYDIGDYATESGTHYHCIQAGSGHLPSTSPTWWEPLVDGAMIMTGEALERGGRDWLAGTTYYVGDVVVDTYGNRYTAKSTVHVATVENAPPFADEWEYTPDGYEVIGLLPDNHPPNAWDAGTSYAVGNYALTTEPGYGQVVKAIRAGVNHEPYVEHGWEMWWVEIDPEDWSIGWQNYALQVEVGVGQFIDGYSNTIGASIRFDGTPDVGEPSSVLPGRPFMSTPFQDRIYVLDIGHGLPAGFSDTCVMFVVSDADYAGMTTICGIDKDFIVTNTSNFDSDTNLLLHKIYVIDESVYYFIPTKLDGTRLTDAQIPTRVMVGGVDGITRYFMPRALVTRPIGPSEFTVYKDKVALGTAPNGVDALSATYASRT